MSIFIRVIDDVLLQKSEMKNPGESLYAVDDDLRASLLIDLQGRLAGGYAICGVIDCTDARAGKAAALRAVLPIRQHWCRGAGVDLDRHRMSRSNN